MRYRRSFLGSGRCVQPHLSNVETSRGTETCIDLCHNIDGLWSTERLHRVSGTHLTAPFIHPTVKSSLARMRAERVIPTMHHVCTR